MIFIVSSDGFDLLITHSRIRLYAVYFRGFSERKAKSCDVFFFHFRVNGSAAESHLLCAQLSAASGAATFLSRLCRDLFRELSAISPSPFPLFSVTHTFHKAGCGANAFLLRSRVLLSGVRSSQ